VRLGEKNFQFHLFFRLCLDEAIQEGDSFF